MQMSTSIVSQCSAFVDLELNSVQALPWAIGLEGILSRSDKICAMNELTIGLV